MIEMTRRTLIASAAACLPAARSWAADAPAHRNPYLSGNFGPIRSEDDFDLAVQGELPKDLAGTLYRIGPNPQFDPPDPDHHWFFGDGMVHAFQVEGGNVRYRNRYVRTPKWRLENEAGRALFGMMGNPATTDPAARGKDGGVANTNIVWHAGKLMALEEGHRPTLMTPGSLETVGYADYPGRVTAHPKVDPETGEMVWFAYSAGPAPLNRQVAYGVTDAAGKVVRHEIFEAPYCSMIHDFMVTKNHVLIPVLPLTGSLQRAMQGLPPFAWEPDKGGHIGVMRRDGGVATLRWFDIEACYVFHPMNAWEEGDRIHADVFCYDDAPLFGGPDGSPGKPAAARLLRWTFDMSGRTGAIKETALDDLDGEFPRFDERRAGLGYRHGFFAADTRETKSVKLNALAHLDLKTGRRTVYELPAGDFTSEPVFTPRSAGAEEGDGWLTAVVYRGAENRSDFLVFEAQDLARGPIAVARLPRRVPFGFHGNWVPA